MSANHWGPRWLIYNTYQSLLTAQSHVLLERRPASVTVKDLWQRAKMQFHAKAAEECTDVLLHWLTEPRADLVLQPLWQWPPYSCSLSRRDRYVLHTHTHTHTQGTQKNSSVRNISVIVQISGDDKEPEHASVKQHDPDMFQSLFLFFYDIFF